MKSFRILVFLIISLSFFNSAMLAQDTSYKPMVLEGAHWFMTGDDCSTIWYDYFYAYVLKGDTIINDTTYKKTYTYRFAVDEVSKSPFYPYQIEYKKLVALLREDTVNRTVWVRFIDSFLANNFRYSCPYLGDYNSYVDTLTPEMLLYDFSLEAGDTLDWCYTDAMRYYWEDDVLQPIVVDSVTTNSYENYCFGEANRRTMHIFGVLLVPCGLQPEYEGSIVEGIGIGEDGLFYGMDSFCGYCIGSDLECNILTSTKELTTENTFRIYPNPSSDFIKFTISASLKNPQLKIYTLTGELIESVSATTQFSVQNLANGIYFVQLLSGDRVLESKKICIQK